MYRPRLEQLEARQLLTGAASPDTLLPPSPAVPAGLTVQLEMEPMGQGRTVLHAVVTDSPPAGITPNASRDDSCGQVDAGGQTNSSDSGTRSEAGTGRLKGNPDASGGSGEAPSALPPRQGIPQQIPESGSLERSDPSSFQWKAQPLPPGDSVSDYSDPGNAGSTGDSTGANEALNSASGDLPATPQNDSNRIAEIAALWLTWRAEVGWETRTGLAVSDQDRVPLRSPIDDLIAVPTRFVAQPFGTEAQTLHAMANVLPPWAGEQVETSKEENLPAGALIIDDPQEEFDETAFAPQSSDLVTSLRRGVQPVLDVGLQLTEQVTELVVTLTGSGTKAVVVSCLIGLAAAGIACEVVRRQVRQVTPRLGLLAASGRSGSWIPE
jgi:hypothetical protein